MKRPQQAGGDEGRIEPPRVIELEPTAWALPDRPAVDGVRQQRRDLFALIQRLREDHQRSINELQERLDRAQAIRKRAYEIRERMRDQRRIEGSPPAGSDR